MIETKRTDVDPWPRDLIDKQNENFRDFEINSKVDAKTMVVSGILVRWLILSVMKCKKA